MTTVRAGGTPGGWGPMDAAIAGLMAISIGVGYYGLTAIIGAAPGEPALFVAGGTAAGLVVNGLAAPPVARAIARHGLRATVAVGALVAGGGLVLAGTADPMALAVGFVAIGAGTAATSYVPAEAAFRGRADAARRLAVAFSAGTLGGIVCAPALALLLVDGGLGALGAVGVVYAAIGVVFSRMLPGLPPAAHRGAARTRAEAGLRVPVVPVSSQPAGPTPAAVGERALARRRLAASSGVLAVTGGVALAVQLNIVTLADRLGVEGATPALVLMPAAALVGRLVVAARPAVTARALLVITAGSAVLGSLALASATTAGVLAGGALVGLSLGLGVLAGPVVTRALGAPEGGYARVLRVVSLGYAAGALVLPLLLERVCAPLVCVVASALGAGCLVVVCVSRLDAHPREPAATS